MFPVEAGCCYHGDTVMTLGCYGDAVSLLKFFNADPWVVQSGR